MDVSGMWAQFRARLSRSVAAYYTARCTYKYRSVEECVVYQSDHSCVYAPSYRG